MKTLIRKKLRIYEDELGTFTWAALLFLSLFFIMAIFRNYVDTAFLKRYDVDKIPLMLVINGFLTYFVLEGMTRLGRACSDSRLLAAFLAGCSLLAGGLYLAVRADMSFAYPVLFQLLHVKDSVLLVYLWNIAGDLFDSRQGKRLFPLVTVSQVLGATLGNFSTDPIIHAFGIDSILVIFCLLCASMALVLSRTAGLAAHGAVAPHSSSKRSSIKPTQIPALMKRYPIVRYLIIAGLIPNILLPVFTYQFSVIADGSFASEHSLAAFFSYFRGSMTLVVLGMLLFMGRVYSSMGLANATLTQPVNFMAVFGSLVLSFNIYAAAFGQCAIRLVQQAVAGPAGKVLFNFVPEEIAAWSRVFVRGTVIKIAVVLGSLLTLALKPVVSQRQLSAIAFCIACYWLMESLLFRKRYTATLKQVLLEDRVDFDKMEASWAEVGMLHPAAAPARDAEIFDESRDPRDVEPPRIDPETALKMLDDPDELTRANAAASFAVSRAPVAVRPLMECLEDREVVRGAAMEALIHYGEAIFPLLESVLAGSNPRVQQAILEIMRLSGHKNPDLSPFFGHQMLEAYNNLVAVKVLSAADELPAVHMLKTHLEEENRRVLCVVFHALWVNHADMRLMYEALSSSDTSIAVEMLEAVVEPGLARYIVPLIDSIPLDARIELGRKALPLIGIETMDRILLHMAGRKDPLTRMLAAYVMGEYSPGSLFLPAVQPLLEDTAPQVRQVAHYATKRCMKEVPRMPNAIELLHTLRDFIIFDGMGIRELQAIAAIARREEYRPGDVILREGEPSHCLYLIIRGRIDRYRDRAGSREQFPGSLGPRSFFGEERLFTELPSEETYVAAEPTEALILSRYHFQEIMKIYPQIGLNLCLFFALRLTVQRDRGRSMPSNHRTENMARITL